MTTQKAVKMRCSHPGCNTPFAERQGHVLLIEAEHHGEKHINAVYLPLDNLPGSSDTKH